MDETMRELVMEAASAEVFGVWFLIGAALVFWMQAGFAMVEAGFTRAKNTGNIIMVGNEEKIMDGAGWLEVDLTGVKVVDPMKLQFL